MDVQEAATVLGLKSTTVYDRRWRDRHRLPTVRVGNRLRFAPADLAAWLERHRETVEVPR
jgi:excisionase family DNA binding protein